MKQTLIRVRFGPGNSNPQVLEYFSTTFGVFVRAQENNSATRYRSQRTLLIAQVLGRASSDGPFLSVVFPKTCSVVLLMVSLHSTQSQAALTPGAQKLKFPDSFFNLTSDLFRNFGKLPLLKQISVSHEELHLVLLFLPTLHCNPLCLGSEM
jgi:hypothetical protein